MIDIVKIRSEADQGILKFYVEDRYIYCENTITEEKVIVGTENRIEDAIDYINQFIFNISQGKSTLRLDILLSMLKSDKLKEGTK